MSPLKVKCRVSKIQIDLGCSDHSLVEIMLRFVALLQGHLLQDKTRVYFYSGDNWER